MKSAAIGVGTLLNGGFINCLSQTAEGYRLAKVRVTIRVRVRVRGRPLALTLTLTLPRAPTLTQRDSAAIYLLFHGIPIAAAASQVLVYLDCQHRSCAVQFRGSDATVRNLSK